MTRNPDYNISPKLKHGGDYMGGSVQPVGDRYVIVIYWQGKHHKISRNPQTNDFFYSKQQAEKLLNYIRVEVDNGSFNPRFYKPDSPLYVEQYYKEWLESITVSKKTATDYRGAFCNHINPAIGKMDIRHLRFKHLEQLYKNLNLSTKGKYNVMGALKSMLRWAYKSEDINRMPAFPTLSIDQPEVEALTREQQTRILEQIPERHRPIFIFGMETGLRTQELRAVQKDCIIDNHVHIRRVFSENTLREGTKTGVKGIRKIPLSSTALAAIEATERHLSPFVFVREDGNPYTNKNLNHIWGPACKKAGITIKMQNAFRHSFGCQLVDQGHEIDKVRQLLGHTNIKMTMRYADRDTSTLLDLVENRGRVVPLKKVEEKT